MLRSFLFCPATSERKMVKAFESLADAVVIDLEDAVAINARHAHALATADDCLGQSLAKLAANAPAELLASDLRGALDAFGEISGKIDSERVLDRLFSAFCIGK